MKKLITIVMVLIVSINVAKAQSSRYSAFLLKSGLNTESPYRAALNELFVNGGAGQWHKSAQSHYVSFLANRFPGVDPLTVLAQTKFYPLPAGTYLKRVGRIDKATGQLSYWKRYSRPGELGGSYNGVLWTLSDCGNLYDDDVAVTPVQIPGEANDYFGEAAPQPRIVSQPQQQQQQQTMQAPQSAQPLIVYVQAPPSQQQQQSQAVYQEAPPHYVSQPVYQPQQQVYDQPTEIIVRNKANAVDWINAGANVAQAWFAGVNTYRGVRFEGARNQVQYANRQVYNDRGNGRDDWRGNDYGGGRGNDNHHGGGQGFPRPSFPDRNNPDDQGFSGYFGNDPRNANNSNGSGLGSGSGGTIWDHTNNNNTGNPYGGYTVSNRTFPGN